MAAEERERAAREIPIVVARKEVIVKLLLI